MPPLSFQAINDHLQAFRHGRVLATALELDLWTAVGPGAAAPQLAAKLAIHPRATEALLDALVAIGALTKSEGTYHNTPDTARFLTSASPDNCRPALMHTVHLWQTWGTLTGAVRAGTAVRPPGVEARDEDWTEAFIAAMHSRASAIAPEVVRAVGVENVARLLDVGGGSAAFSIAFAQADPDLRAEVFDLPPVLPIAQRHIRAAGLETRVTTRPGDLEEDDFGEGYDLILLSAICHMLGPDGNRDLIRRCAAALALSGRLVIRDFILEPDRTAPPMAALFALNMLVGTRDGSTYTESEYRDWCAAAGLTQVARPDPAGDLLIARRPVTPQ